MAIAKWRYKQELDGVLGFEWRRGKDFEELKERIRQETGRKDSIITQYQENGPNEVRFYAAPACRFWVSVRSGRTGPEIANTEEPSSADHYIGPRFPLDVCDFPSPLPGGVPKGGALGIRFIEYNVPWNRSKGAANPLASIVSTYKIMFPKTEISSDGVNETAVVHIGHSENPQALRYKLVNNEDAKIYDGHHLAIYVNDFVAAFHNAARHSLVWENPVFPQFQYRNESDVRKFDEFRFKDFVCPETKEVVFELEHEVRSLRHAGCWINKEIWGIEGE